MLFFQCGVVVFEFCDTQFVLYFEGLTFGNTARALVSPFEFRWYNRFGRWDGRNDEA